jgi:hypothetical protein
MQLFEVRTLCVFQPESRWRDGRQGSHGLVLKLTKLKYLTFLWFKGKLSSVCKQKQIFIHFLHVFP